MKGGGGGDGRIQSILLYFLKIFIFNFIFYIKEKEMVPCFWFAPRDVLVESDVVLLFFSVTRLNILLFFSLNR